MSSFSLILRKSIEKLSRISHEKHSRPEVIHRNATGSEPNESLLDQVQCYNSKGTFQPLMGVGQIGDGIKRIRFSKEKENLIQDRVGNLSASDIRIRHPESGLMAGWICNSDSRFQFYNFNIYIKFN